MVSVSNHRSTRTIWHPQPFGRADAGGPTMRQLRTCEETAKIALFNFVGGSRVLLQVRLLSA